MLYPYPDSVNFEALTLLYKKWKGEDVILSDLIHACWDICGGLLNTGIIGSETKVISDNDYKEFEQLMETDAKQGVLTTLMLEVALQIALHYLNKFLKK